MVRRPPRSALCPYTPLFRSLVDVAEQARPADLPGPLEDAVAAGAHREDAQQQVDRLADRPGVRVRPEVPAALALGADRKSTRLNSSHANMSYAVFCLKKKYP